MILPRKFNRKGRVIMPWLHIGLFVAAVVIASYCMIKPVPVRAENQEIKVCGRYTPRFNFPAQIDTVKSAPQAVRNQEYILSSRERNDLERLIWLEARGEGLRGMMAVAEVVKNRLESGNYGRNIEQIIYAKNQFTPAYLISSTQVNREARWAVSLVFDCNFTVLTGKPVMFMTPEYVSESIIRKWDEKYKRVDKIGGMVFYEQKKEEE